MSDTTPYVSNPIPSAATDPISSPGSDPTLGPGEASAPTTEDQLIRERVKGLTSQALKGRIDPDAMRDVVRAMMGQTPAEPARGPESRESLVAAVRLFDEALTTSAAATHATLQQLASRGRDFTDNDLKDALASLRRLEEDCVAAANRIAEAMSGNLRREITELALHAQSVGVEASTRVAAMMGEFANNLGAASGLATIRGAGVRMTMLASGMLAGIADALRDQTQAKG